MFEKLNQPITIGKFIKLMICLNVVVLAFCFLVCNIRTTQDEETLVYIQKLENRIDTQAELILLQKEMINKLRK